MSLGIKERFEKNIKIDSVTECWVWQSKSLSNGYGKMVINGKTTRTHRVSYELFNGNIPNNMYVLHKCDNRLCNNPKHLFLGTHIENMKDMVEKNRSLKGIKNIHAKLSEKDVFEIKNRIKLGEQKQEIAKYFKVSNALISLISSNKKWTHI